MTKPPHRVEVHRGPDSLGRYEYTLFWMADYHPGHPDGEHRWAERAQVFHCVPRDSHRKLFPKVEAGVAVSDPVIPTG